MDFTEAERQLLIKALATYHQSLGESITLLRTAGARLRNTPAYKTRRAAHEKEQMAILTLKARLLSSPNRPEGMPAAGA